MTVISLPRSTARPGHRPRRVLFPLSAAILAVLVSASAWSDVYKWTDERGNTVISNARPRPADNVRNFEVTVEDPKGSAKAMRPVLAATPTEQLLLDKIEGLERRLQPQPVPPANYYGSYPPAPPPPAPAGYYGSDYFGYYYPSFASYPSVFYPSRTIVSRPRSAFGHSGFAHSGFARGGAVHRGRR